ncbi:MAG: glycosyltransferase family 4 protein [Bacteriovoracaceae bacterium]|nr:glycosyltransferase family 4 protein [Bacteriovoracaceae bacterium]
MKIALIRKTESSKWVSCRSITDNIETAYKDAYDNVSTFFISESADKVQMFLEFKKIKDENFDLVAFIDHKPTPLNVFNSMEMAFSSYDPQVIIHVFGDFTLYSSEWSSVEKILKERPVKFVVASGAQKKLISHFVEDDSIVEIPFPVHENFKFDSQKREKTRAKYNLKNEQVFLYTGRISSQKNVIELVKSFSSTKNQMGLDAKLLICGEFDDLGIPFLGKVMPEGSSIQNYYKELSRIEGSIEFLGNLEQDELIDLYSAVDCFLSLSTHNDEDYGMSPAEALCSGLPCLLTSWGGYNSFAKMNSDNVKTVSVNIEGDRLLPDLTNLRKQLMGSSKLDNDGRKKLSDEMREILLPSKIGKVIKNNLENIKVFSGFKDELKKFSSCIELNPKAPFRSGAGGYSDYYKKIYACYQEQ